MPQKTPQKHAISKVWSVTLAIQCLSDLNDIPLMAESLKVILFVLETVSNLNLNVLNNFETYIKVCGSIQLFS